MCLYMGSDTGILKLRKTRQRIRRTLNLVGDGQRITETPGTWWRANLDTRQVEWALRMPFEPHDEITDNGIRYLCAHEASHIKWSGLYTTTTIPDNLKELFHRFVNAIEDIRVDRLSARQFGTFDDIKHEFRIYCRAGHGTTPEGWSLVDAVGLNAIFAFDVGEEPEGTAQAIEASTRLWPLLDRIGNHRSTQAVATDLEPIFNALIQQEPPEEGDEEGEGDGSGGAQGNPNPDAKGQQGDKSEQEAGEAQEGGGGEGEEGDSDGEVGVDGSGSAGQPQDGDEDGSGGRQKPDGEQPPSKSSASGSGNDPGQEDDGEDGEGDGEGGVPGIDDMMSGLPKPGDVGADEPTDAPIKSDGDEETAPLGIGEDLEGMAEDATLEEAKHELERLALGVDAAHSQNVSDKNLQVGHRAPPTGGVYYKDRLHEMRGKINILAQRLKTTLRHNAMQNPQGGQRRGRFNPGKAYRLKTGNIRIFTKPGVMGGLDYTFGLLVDCSGSMYSRTDAAGQPKAEMEIEGAFKATVLVAEALDMAGLGLFVILWDDMVRHFKPIHEPLKGNHQKAIGTVLGTPYGGGGTTESLAIALALDEFEKVEHGKRLMMVVTDGNSGTIGESKELIEELERHGVHCCTIRIGGPPGAHYKKGYSVDYADQLTKLLPQLINEVVTRN